jgi:WD40 repeat protein
MMIGYNHVHCPKGDRTWRKETRMAGDNAIASVVDAVAATADEDGEIQQNEEAPDAVPLQWFEYDPRMPAWSLMVASREFHSAGSHNNFTKGVRVSPDGLCILTNSDDHVLRLFEIPHGDGQSSTEQVTASIVQIVEVEPPPNRL